MKIKPQHLVIAGAAVAALLVVSIFASSALLPPTTADYGRLDAQRRALDMSMNTYGPLFDGFSSDYDNAVREERSKDEIASVKKAHVDLLEEERDLNLERLGLMRSSAALRQPDVRESFESYDSAYSAVVKYYDQRTADIANITESIVGPCAKLSQMNTSLNSFAADYVTAADVCLSALDTAKKTSGPTTKTLLSDVDAIVSKRRDAFSEVSGKEGFDQTISRLNALLTLLDINAEVSESQSRYESSVEDEYTKLVNNANSSNNAFGDVLKDYMGDAKKESEG